MPRVPGQIGSGARAATPGPAGGAPLLGEPHAASPSPGQASETAWRLGGLFGGRGRPSPGPERRPRELGAGDPPPGPQAALTAAAPRVAAAALRVPGSPRAQARPASPGLCGTTAPPRGPGEASQKWQRGVFGIFFFFPMRAHCLLVLSSANTFEWLLRARSWSTRFSGSMLPFRGT